MSGDARPIEASSRVTAISRLVRSSPLIGGAASKVEADGDRARMRVEAFRLGERDRRRRERAKARPRRASGCEVRFMKSSTERPEEKRAERAVGSTWFEPAT